MFFLGESIDAEEAMRLGNRESGRSAEDLESRNS
jgi:hypothetical protein